MIEFPAYLDELIAAKRADPGDDLTSALTSDDAPHDLSYEETRAWLANLVFGGLEATAKAITTGVYHLLVHDQWSVLAERPKLAPRACEVTPLAISSLTSRHGTPQPP